jgi:hypothetical protein
MPSLGTRGFSRQTQLHPAGGSLNSIATGDLGMTKRVTASMTWGSGEVSAANGTFAGFAVGDPIEAIGTVLNAGFWTVTGIDAANQSYFTLDGSPKSEGPISSTIRTI